MEGPDEHAKLDEDEAADLLDAAGSRPAGAGDGPAGGGESGGGAGEGGGSGEGPGQDPPGEWADIPDHRPEPHVCQGCGAVAGPNGELLDNTCLCGPEGPTWDKLERPELVSTVDIETGYPNIYAQRIKKRLTADAHYLLLQAKVGHPKAAEATCEEYGHDARAGLCERCGARLGRAFE